MAFLIWMPRVITFIWLFLFNEWIRRGKKSLRSNRHFGDELALIREFFFGSSCYWTHTIYTYKTILTICISICIYYKISEWKRNVMRSIGVYALNSLDCMILFPFTATIQYILRTAMHFYSFRPTKKEKKGEQFDTDIHKCMAIVLFFSSSLIHLVRTRILNVRILRDGERVFKWANVRWFKKRNVWIRSVYFIFTFNIPAYWYKYNEISLSVEREREIPFTHVVHSIGL